MYFMNNIIDLNKTKKVRRLKQANVLKKYVQYLRDYLLKIKK